MSELDNALDRLGEAISGLIAGDRDSQRKSEDATQTQITDLTAERDGLAAQVKKLQIQRKADADLRADAAEAVKIALRDLRGLVAAQERSGQDKSKKGGKNG